MKLRNKKTGEMGNLVSHGCEDERLWVWCDNISKPENRYNSLAELNEEWEDYEEPKDFWYIDVECGVMCDSTNPDLQDKRYPMEFMKSIGNYFETREEAERAVEKLKAWKRLKEQGFRFKTYQRSPQGTYDIYANWDGYMPPLSWMIDKDLNLCFGGEE